MNGCLAIRSNNVTQNVSYVVLLATSLILEQLENTVTELSGHLETIIRTPRENKTQIVSYLGLRKHYNNILVSFISLKSKSH